MGIGNYFSFLRKEDLTKGSETNLSGSFDPSPEMKIEWYEVYSDEFDNKVYSEDGLKEFDSVNRFFIQGGNNRVFLSKSSNIKKLRLNIIGNNSKIFVGEGSRLIGDVNIKGNGRCLIVGNNTTFQNVSIIIKEKCDVFVGHDCMFSSRIEIRTSDSHSIFDVETGRRLNKPGNVYIHDHVWLGKDVIVSKGVEISKNCVVGAKSFVNKSLLDSNCLYAGVPAKKIRSNINWTRELLPFDN